MSANAANIQPPGASDPASEAPPMRARTLHGPRAEGPEDPVLAALHRAPPMSPETAARCRALNADVQVDPGRAQTPDEFMAWLAASHPGAPR